MLSASPARCAQNLSVDESVLVLGIVAARRDRIAEVLF